MPLKRGKSAAVIAAYAAAATVGGVVIVTAAELALRDEKTEDQAYPGQKVGAAGDEAGLYKLATEERARAQQALAKGDWARATENLDLAEGWYADIAAEPETRALRARALAMKAEAGAAADAGTRARPDGGGRR